MVTRNKITALLIGGSLVIGASGIANADVTNEAIKTAVESIDKKFKTYSDNIQKYYGIADTTNPMGIPTYSGPTKYTMSDYNNAKSDRTSLAAMTASNDVIQRIAVGFSTGGKLYDSKFTTDDNGSNLVTNLIAQLTAIPYQAACNNCSLTVETLTKDMLADVEYTNPYINPLGMIPGAQATGPVNPASVKNALDNPSKNTGLSLDALLGPVKYQEQLVMNPDDPMQGGKVAGKDALSFVRALVSNKFYTIASELPNVQELDKSGMEARDKYIKDTHNFIAQISVPISNFQQIYAARVPVNGGMSKMEAEKKMVMRHLAASWQDNIKSADTLTVQRETAMLLAEINYQMFQNRLLLERLLATESTSGIMMARPPRAPGGGSQPNF